MLMSQTRDRESSLSPYTDNADGVIFCFDVTSVASWRYITGAIRAHEQRASRPYVAILCAMKNDQSWHPDLSIDEVYQVALEYVLLFTSSL